MYAASHISYALGLLFREKPSPHVRRFESGGIHLYTGEESVWGNFALGLELPELTDDGLTSAWGVKPALVAWPGPRSSTVDQAFEACGYAHAGAMPAMELDLSKLTRPELPRGYRFGRIRVALDAAGWNKAVEMSYPVPPLAAQAVGPSTDAFLDAPDSPIQYFAIWKDAAIVGVSMMVLANDLAGLYSIAVDPEHRGKGLGSALTAYPLHAALRLGYAKGVLQASQEGRPVYTKLGFKEVGEVQLYMPSPS